jgi:hypothetical protein
MKNNKPDDQQLFFSTDAEENLKIENEILHLKLKAELGGELLGSGSLLPALENQFLKNILEFEHAYANSGQVKIFDLIGRPSFNHIDSLNDEEISQALQEIDLLLKQKQIILEFSGTYHPRLRYKFITEEFFEQQTDSLQIAGMITHYFYEEYHPDHRSEIESKVTAFIEGWIHRETDMYSIELSDSIISPDGTVFSKEHVLHKIQEVFAAYHQFLESSYSIESIVFDLNEDNETGSGLVQGFMSYNAISVKGDTVKFEGSFEFRLLMEYNWWSVTYFIFPGITW